MEEENLLFNLKPKVSLNQDEILCCRHISCGEKAVRVLQVYIGNSTCRKLLTQQEMLRQRDSTSQSARTRRTKE